MEIPKSQSDKVKNQTDQNIWEKKQLKHQFMSNLFQLPLSKQPQLIWKQPAGKKICLSVQEVKKPI